MDEWEEACCLDSWNNEEKHGGSTAAVGNTGVYEYIVVELEGLMDMGHMEQEELTNSILGLNTEGPMLQTGKLLFTGHYEEVLGTCILLEDTAAPETDPDGSGQTAKERDKQKPLGFSTLVTKKLRMQRAFLQDKTQRNADENRPPSSEESEKPKDSSSPHPGEIPSTSTKQKNERHEDISMDCK